MKRREAVASGDEFYNTGKRCKWGHDTGRVTKTGVCIGCTKDGVHRAPYVYKPVTEETKAYMREYYQNNKAANRAASIRFMKTDKGKAVRSKTYAKHRTEIRRKSCIAAKRWRLNNPELAKKRNADAYQKKKDIICKYYRDRYEDNKERLKQYQKEYNKLHPEKGAANAYRRIQRIKDAKPKWYETDLVKQLYLKRNELRDLWGMVLHVDHIIPIDHKLVCGLHCWNNLQILEGGLNSSKSNHYDVTQYEYRKTK